MSARLGHRWRFEDRSGEPFVLVDAVRARPGERDSAVDPPTARWILENSWRSWWGDGRRGELVEIHAAVSHETLNVRNLTTDELARRVLDAAARGHVLVFRASGGAQASGRTDAIAVLVRQVMGARRELFFEGHAYRIADLSIGGAGSEWQDSALLEHAEAVAAVERMAERLPRSTEERSRWAALLAFMKGDGREPRVGLLRVRRAAAAAPPPEPAPTPRPPPPRPPQPQEDLSWIEVRVTDTAGTPYAGRVRLKLPNGASVDASTDQDGVVRLDGILPGNCVVTLLDVSERLRAA
jgi:hypothetical protein